MSSCDFPGVERAFYRYTEDCKYLESLEDRKATLPAFKSASDLSERVNTGGSYSDPVSIWFENLEFLEGEIARTRLRTIPIAKLLEYLKECEPDMLTLFQCRYVKKMTWFQIEEEMCLDKRSCQRIRNALVTKGGRFLNVGK